MSEATHSSTNLTCVYVRLLGEGTVVFRPATAIPTGPDIVRLLVPDNYDPDDEDWEFKPGSLVRVERQTLDGSEAYVAVASAE